MIAYLVGCNLVMDPHERALLHNVDRRLARVEERVTDIPSIAEKLDRMDRTLTQLQIRIAGIAGGAGAVAAAVVQLIASVWR